MTVSPSVGAQTFMGYAVETTPGTAVVSDHWVPIEPDNLTTNYDPKRTPVELGVGTLFVDQYAVENDATVSGDVAFPLMGGLGQHLIFQAAFLDTFVAGVSGAPGTHTGTITKPKYVTLEVFRAGTSFTYAGMLARMLKIEAAARQYAKATVTFDGIAFPDDTTTPSVNTYATDQPYVWGNFSPVTLMAAGSTTSVESVEIDVEFDNQLFYGSNNSQLPTLIIPGAVTVHGRFTMLFSSIAQYDSFTTLGQTPAAMRFKWTRGTGNGLTSVQIDMPKCVYTKQSFKNPIRGPITEDYEFTALAPVGTIPITYTVKNQDALAYSAA